MSAEKPTRLAELPLAQEFVAAIAEYHQADNAYAFLNRVRALLGEQGEAIMNQLYGVHADGYLGTVNQTAGAITLLAVQRALHAAEVANAETVLIPRIPNEVLLDPADTPLPVVVETVPDEARALLSDVEE